MTAIATERLAPDAAGLARAIALLNAGGLVAFATETVYGLGADATNAQAVAAIFAAKGRPHINPLICHYPTAQAAWADTTPCDVARALAAAFWPGPLTLVLPRRADSRVAPLAGAGGDTLAVRVPDHPVALALAAGLSRPIAAPSANRSGAVSPTTADHVLAGLDGRIDAIIDSGPTRVGLESTVLDLASGRPALLRPGGLPIEAIEALIGPVLIGPVLIAPVARDLPSAAAAATPPLRSPGLMHSHYAPTLPVRLNALTVGPDEALLAFGPPLPGAGACFQLSDHADLTEAAARLFAGLRELDSRGQATGLRAIAVMEVPHHGLGLAINDRLTRASAPRPAAESRDDKIQDSDPLSGGGAER